MHQAALPQRGTHGPLERADQPGRAVADHQQRAAQPAFADPAPAHVPSSRCDPSIRFTTTVIATPIGVPRLRMNPDHCRPADLTPPRRVALALAG